MRGMAGRFRLRARRGRPSPPSGRARPVVAANGWLRQQLAVLRSRRVGRPSWTTYRGRGAPPGWRTAKTTLAAVLAYELARWLLGSHEPLLAPLTALLVAQITVFETIKSGLERVGSVVAGVLVAVLLSKVVGLTWWSLAIVIFAWSSASCCTLVTSSSRCPSARCWCSPWPARPRPPPSAGSSRR